MAGSKQSSEAPHARSVPPPLGLAHLWLYLAVASAYLGVAVSWRLNPPEDLRAAADSLYWRIVSVPPALWNAATATVFILLEVWTVKRHRVWNEPGHWLALWFVWNLIAPFIGRQLFQLVRVLSGVGVRDDWSDFWPWAKAVFAVQVLPPAVVFCSFALGWRLIANTWPWRLYFALVGILTWGGVIHHLSYDWGDKLRAAWPKYDYVMSVVYIWQWRLLIVAMVNDLLPGRPRRHWSHWVPPVQSMLAHYVQSPLTSFVWNVLHPPHHPG